MFCLPLSNGVCFQFLMSLTKIEFHYFPFKHFFISSEGLLWSRMLLALWKINKFQRHFYIAGKGPGKGHPNDHYQNRAEDLPVLSRLYPSDLFAPPHLSHPPVPAFHQKLLEDFMLQQRVPLPNWPQMCAAQGSIFVPKNRA